MYRLSVIILNRVLCLTLSLSLCLSCVLCTPKLSIKPAFSVFGSLLLPHVIFYIHNNDFNVDVSIIHILHPMLVSHIGDSDLCTYLSIESVTIFRSSQASVLLRTRISIREACTSRQVTTRLRPPDRDQ